MFVGEDTAAAVLPLSYRDDAVRSDRIDPHPAQQPNAVAPNGGDQDQPADERLPAQPVRGRFVPPRRSRYAESEKELNSPSAAPGSSVFDRLGRCMVRRPLTVLGFWVVLAAVLFLALPPLAQVAGQRPPDFLPHDAKVLVASKQMIKAFNEPDSQNTLLVLLTDEKGLTASDEAVYQRLVDKLRANRRDVVAVQDFISKPPLRDVMTSTDHKAWTLPVNIAGALGSPGGNESTSRAIHIVKETTKRRSLTPTSRRAASTCPAGSATSRV